MDECLYMIELPITSDITEDEYYMISNANHVEAREKIRNGEDETIIMQEVILLSARTIYCLLQENSKQDYTLQ